MATVHITMNTVQARDLNGFGVPVVSSVPQDSVTVTSSATDTDAVGVLGVAGGYWELVVSGGNVYAAFGTNPDAGADPGRHLILDGERFSCLVTAAGEEVSIKDA